MTIHRTEPRVEPPPAIGQHSWPPDLSMSPAASSRSPRTAPGSPSCSSRPRSSLTSWCPLPRHGNWGHRRILYHRRGYAGSSPAPDAWSIRDDARDCLHLLKALRITRAHVVGLSYAGAVALQLATDAPGVVHTLTLLEPPPVHITSADQFRAVNAELLRIRDEHGPGAALDSFLTMLTGPDWRAVTERQLPGAVAQMGNDAATFFDTDIPALLGWQYSADAAARVSCPVQHIGGTDSGPWFHEVRDQVLAWFPHAADVVLDGADHTLALTHPDQIADALAVFIARHPLPPN